MCIHSSLGRIYIVNGQEFNTCSICSGTTRATGAITKRSRSYEPRIEKISRDGRPVASFEITPTEDEIEDLNGCLTRKGDHIYFDGAGKRHIDVTLNGDAAQRTLVSVARVYWALYRPEPFSEKDHVVNVCGNSRETDTGDGLCLAHLAIKERK